MVVFANIKHQPQKFNNTGDRFCSPFLYYTFPFDTTYRCIVRDSFEEVNYPLILGGGGLFQQWFIDNVFPKFKNKIKIVWGSGTNYHGETKIILPNFLSDWDIVGLRDKGTIYDWVPCVSAKNKLFDNNYNSKFEFVIYEHAHQPINIKSLTEAPKLNNTGFSMREKIDFIGSGEYIITNTYHGAYWGMLLNKKVIIYEPFSNRCLFFPWNVTIADRFTFKDKIKSCASFNILQECREVNDAFYERVCNLILN